SVRTSHSAGGCGRRPPRAGRPPRAKRGGCLVGRPSSRGCRRHRAGGRRGWACRWVTGILFNQTGQLRNSGKSAKPINESIVDPAPSLIGALKNWARLHTWPLPCPFFVGVRPGEDLFFGVFGRVLDVTHSSILRK